MNFWSLVTIAVIAAVVVATLITFFREQEVLARYDWKKRKIEELRAEQEQVVSEANETLAEKSKSV